MPNKDYTLLNIEDTFQDVLFKNTENYLQDGTGSYLTEIKISGSLYADNLYVSQSTIFKSGSTQFGDSADDTHIFTGSVSINGDLNATSLNNNGSGSITIENRTSDPASPSVGQI